MIRSIQDVRSLAEYREWLANLTIMVNHFSVDGEIKFSCIKRLIGRRNISPIYRFPSASDCSPERYVSQEVLDWATGLENRFLEIRSLLRK